MEAVAADRAKGKGKGKKAARLNRFAKRTQWAYVDQRQKRGGRHGTEDDGGAPVMIGGGGGSSDGGRQAMSVRQVGFWPHMRFDQRQYRQELSTIGLNPKAAGS